jgi:hypothetical protein
MAASFRSKFLNHRNRKAPSIMAFLSTYTEVPDSATVGGAPIDAFQARAFAHNDKKFEELLRGLTHSYLGWLRNDGSDGPQTHSAAAKKDPTKIWRATQFTITGQWDLTPGVPLIVMATEFIDIQHTINAKGAGLPASPGNMGGAGGGSTTNKGFDALLPIAGGVLVAGGPSAPVGGGANVQTPPAPVAPAFSSLFATFPPKNDILYRMLSMAPMLAGGATGGGPNGGNGGGVVILIAPEIRMVHALAKVDASGANPGIATGGGGGGGCVIYITASAASVTGFANMNNAPATAEKVDVMGGNGNGTGGTGRRLLITMP